MPRFSAHLTQLFTERPFRERFALAAENGFVACEFRSPFEFEPDEIVAWSRAAALPIILFNAPTGDWAAGERGIASLPGRETEFRAGIERALRYADALDVPMVHVMAGIANHATDAEPYRKTFIDNLRFAARALAPSGRTLLIEAINAKDMPGYFLTTQQQAHAIRTEVDEPNLFVQMDCYHAAMMGEDIATLLREHIADIRHIQIAGAPGRHEPDTGELDYREVFTLIDRLPYEGWVGCEYQPSGDTAAGLAWMHTCCDEQMPTSRAARA